MFDKSEPINSHILYMFAKTDDPKQRKHDQTKLSQITFNWMLWSYFEWISGEPSSNEG